MIKKESLNRIISKILERELQPFLEARGYKFKKSTQQFLKSVNGYTVQATCRMAYSPLVLLEDNETVVIEAGFYLANHQEKFQKWYKSHFIHGQISATAWNNYMAPGFKRNGQFPCYLSFDLGQIQQSDFFEPSKARLFKQQVSIALAGNNIPPPEPIPFLNEFLENKLDELLEMAEAHCTDTQLEQVIKKHRFGFDYSSFLLFQGRTEDAKNAFISHHQDLTVQTTAIDFSEREDKADCLAALNLFIRYGKELLGLDLNEAATPEILSSPSDAKIQVNRNIQFNAICAVDCGAHGFNNYYINHQGDTIIAHGYNLVTIWDRCGKKLAQVKITTSNERRVGYIAAQDVFFLNNFLITRNGDITELTAPTVTVNRQKKPVEIYRSAGPVYLLEAEEWVVHFAYIAKKPVTEVRFYQKDASLLRTLSLPDDILEVLPKQKWIITCKHNSHFTVYDFLGNKLATLESNNAYPGGSLLMQYHCFTGSASHLFSYSYYVKSQLFDLSNFSVKMLWGHTTYEKDYKELYYNNINHNFGINTARFSPDETYLVAGACHGKYVAWSLPEAKRTELIPDADYLKKMPDAAIITIGKNTYLNNRMHQMGNIQFWEKGDYFSFQINDDTLFFDRNFKHCHTIENGGPIKCFGDFVGLYKDEKLTIYTRHEMSGD